MHYVVGFMTGNDSLTDIHEVSEVTGLSIDEIKKSFEDIELPDIEEAQDND